MRFTTWAEYGLIAAVHLARRVGQGPVANGDLHPVDPGRCDPRTACSIRPVWRLLERRINDVLSGVSLGDLLHDESDIDQIAGSAATG